MLLDGDLVDECLHWLDDLLALLGAAVPDAAQGDLSAVAGVHHVDEVLGQRVDHFQLVLLLAVLEVLDEDLVDEWEHEEGFVDAAAQNRAQSGQDFLFVLGLGVYDVFQALVLLVLLLAGKDNTIREFFGSKFFGWNFVF